MALLIVGVSCSPKWSCDSSWCYYLSDVRVDHSPARADCDSQNAELVSISDVAENNFVTSIWSVD